jgi:hypothetical protein
MTTIPMLAVELWKRWRDLQVSAVRADDVAVDRYKSSQAV